MPSKTSDNGQAESNPKSPLYLFFTGCCMGAADVVPGVSGGTMAFIMGVYEQLLAAVKSVDIDFAKKLLRFEFVGALAQIPWRFLIPLIAGIGCSVGVLAKVVTYLMHEHQELLFAFFFGLVAASIVALAARLTWTVSGVIGMVAGTVFAYWLVGLVPRDPGHSPLILFGSGALAICAMILPGIYGSFILLILGQYEYCVAALSQLITDLKDLNFAAVFSTTISTVIPLVTGMVLGLGAFSRILSWLLAKYHNLTVATLTGFMIGSLRRIWPFKENLEFMTNRHGEQVPIEWRNCLPDALDQHVFLALGLCVAGFILITIIDHIHDRKNPIMLLLWRPKTEA
ncbi:MAG: DUF368 domain-containing protein [Pirellulaceae bacterium]